MKKRNPFILAIGALLIQLSLLNAQTESNRLTPAQEPVIQQDLVKPNVYMILDNSGSMHWLPEVNATPYSVAYYDHLKPYVHYLDHWIKWQPNNPSFTYEEFYKALDTKTRVVILRETVLDLVDEYADHANMGFSLLSKYQVDFIDMSQGVSDPSVELVWGGDRNYVIYPHKTQKNLKKFDYIREDLDIQSYDGFMAYSLISPILDTSIDENKTHLKHLLTKYTDGYAPHKYLIPNSFNLRSWTPNNNQLFTNGGTTLGPSLYEATKYFRNIPIHYGVGRNLHYTKPFAPKYRCEQNHIILLTDGQQNEYYVVGENYGIVNQEVSPAGVNLAGAAKVMRSLDLRDYPFYTFDEQGNKTETKVDAAGKSWKDFKDPINLTLHTIGFALNAVGPAENPGSSDQAQKDLEEAARIGGGTANSADNREELNEAFQNIFKNIILTRSGTGSVEDQSNRTLDSIYYTTTYHPYNWEGEIVAYTLGDSSTTFDKKLWSTHDTMTYGQGEYISFDGQRTIDLENLSGLDKDQMKWIKRDPTWLGLEGSTQEKNPARLNYRKKILLGDIINSDLTMIKKDALNTNIELMSKPRKEAYIDYLLQKNRDKKLFNFLVTGSNDGLLNFIYAEKGSTDKDKDGKSIRRGGQRHTSYFPAFFAGKDAEEITAKDYQHRYKINGFTSLFDANDRGVFKSIGITAMGAGKKGLVGYQTYDSVKGSEIKVNFEIESTMPKFGNLGYTYSNPDFFVHSNNGEEQTVAVFGNGYTLDTHQRSSIYLIDAISGKLINEILLPGSKGGASSPATLISLNKSTGLHQLERIYVGDQYGKLFKIQFNSTDLTMTPTISLMFDAGGADYPITVRPTLAKDKAQNVWVYFGTGRAILESDVEPIDKPIQHAFYGLKDDGSMNQIMKTNLNRHQVLTHKERPNYAEQKVVTTTKNPVVSASEKHLGWYLPLTFWDMTNQNGEVVAASGERVIRPALTFYDQYIVFTTYGVNHPSIGGVIDPCVGNYLFGQLLYLNLFTGGASEIMELDGSGIALDTDVMGLPSGTGLSNGKDLSGQDLTPLSDELVGRLRQENDESHLANPDEVRENLENGFLTEHHATTEGGGKIVPTSSLKATPNSPGGVPGGSHELMPKRLYIKSIH